MPPLVSAPAVHLARERILAIDLGATNAVMAVIQNGKPTVLENAKGSRLTPSTPGVLKKLKRDAEARLGGPIGGAVVAVPRTSTISSARR